MLGDYEGTGDNRGFEEREGAWKSWSLVGDWH
jgi:hypothetical protein